MNVLASRLLSCPNENGNETEARLTVFTPFEERENLWKCGFELDPPIYTKVVYGAGIDFIQAFVGCLKVARIFLETTKMSGRIHWQGMMDCGLPAFRKAPASRGAMEVRPPADPPRSTDVLTTRMLGFPSESGEAVEYPLTIFVPLRSNGGQWSCGFTLGPPESEPVRYGVGADFLEALLDCLAMARAIFEGKVPQGSIPSDDLLDCADLPYKIGRSFWTDMGRGSASEAPYASAR